MNMVQDIRGHVLTTGHRVRSEDDPFMQKFGYTCMTCGEHWECGLLALRELDAVRLREVDFPVEGLLQGRDVRDRLTSYLHWELGELIEPVPPKVPILSRYRRPWVI